MYQPAVRNDSVVQFMKMFYTKLCEAQEQEYLTQHVARSPPGSADAHATKAKRKSKTKEYAEDPEDGVKANMQKKIKITKTRKVRRSTKQPRARQGER